MRRVSQVVETAIHVGSAPPVIRIVTAEQSGPEFTAFTVYPRQAATPRMTWSRRSRIGSTPHLEPGVR
jgi:hypothetical protein